MRRILKEIALAAWLPTTAGTLTFATSWLVWFLTEPGCVPSPTMACPKLPWGMYITHDVLGDCYIRTFIAISVTGGSDIMLFIRELRNREKDKKIADERLEQEKERLEQEKERNDRMMTLTENMMQQTADRAAAAEERAAADRQALTEALANFTNALNDRNNRRRPRRRNLRPNGR